MRNLITGGAGFIGAHLVDRLMGKGEEVFCVDNFSIGRKDKVLHWLGDPKFELIRHDITNPIDIEVDRIWHLACPAAPAHYRFDPIKTARVNFLGTYNMLELAREKKARLLLASSSSVYGCPDVIPRHENSYGNCMPITERSCYDDGKRVAESLCFDYTHTHGVETRVARIFNTYGPGMHKRDGRVVSTFIEKALKREKITLNGHGRQYRSFCYIDDLINGLMLVMDADDTDTFNLGNPEYIAIGDLARLIWKKVNILYQNNEEFKYVDETLPRYDPMQRQPVIDKARRELGWKNWVQIDAGLDRTISDFMKTIQRPSLS